MHLTNEWIERGKAEGRQEGRQELFLELLSYRIGSVPAPLIRKVEKLTDQQLNELARALLSFEDIGDAKKWFATITTKP